LAATKKTNHHHAAKPTAAARASPGMMGAMGGASKADRDMYMKNERDAGLAGKKQ
jgi:hypothetical protein